MNTDTTLRQVKLFQTEIIQNFDENSEFDERVNYSLEFKGNVIRKWIGGAEYVGGWNKGEMDGIGIYSFDGCKFKGEFKKHNINGYGQF
jgi:hypothetical protein